MPPLRRDVKARHSFCPGRSGGSWKKKRIRAERGVEKMDLFSWLQEAKPMSDSSNGLIYHYTSLEILELFLKFDGDFWCTQFCSLNDRTEMTMGATVAAGYFKIHYGWTVEKCLWFRKLYEDFVFRNMAIMPWVFSFSRARDSLYQWGMYTNRAKGGVAVGFDRRWLIDLIDRRPCQYSAAANMTGTLCKYQLYDLRLLPCLYVRSDSEKIEELMALSFEGCENEISRLSELAPGDRISDEDVLRVMSAILNFSPIIKHESFIHEEEERLVLYPKTRNLVDVELKGGKPRWRSYISEAIKIHNDKGEFGKDQLREFRHLIKEIMISPHGDQQSLLMNVGFLRIKAGIEKCLLSRSDSPYDGR